MPRGPQHHKGEPLSRAIEFMADAHALARKYCGPAGLDVGQALSAAYMGVLKGLRTYDARHGASVRTHVRHHIKWAIFDEGRAWHALGIERGVKITVVPLQDHHLIFDPPDTALEEEASRVILARVFLKLNARQRSVLQMKLRGFNGVAIGKRLGITKGRVSQLLKQIRTIWKEK